MMQQQSYVSSTTASGRLWTGDDIVIIRDFVYSAETVVLSPEVIAPAVYSQTSSGGQPVAGPSPESAIAESRRLTGFSWEQFGRLLGVSRRSIHFWLSGEPMTLANEEKANRLLVVLRAIDRGSANANRSALLQPLPTGEIPFDLLIAGKHNEVIASLGATRARTKRLTTPLSYSAIAARKPMQPALLVDALNDPVKTIGTPVGRVASTARNKKRG